MNTFDNKIKEVINKYNSDIDPNEIWEGIQNKRYTKKKKRRFAFIIIAASILLLFTISIFILKNTTKVNTLDTLNDNIIVENKNSLNANTIDKNISNKINLTVNSNLDDKIVSNKSNEREELINDFQNIINTTNQNLNLKTDKSKSENKKNLVAENNKETRNQRENKINKNILFLKLSKVINPLKHSHQLAYNFKQKTYIVEFRTKSNPSIELDIAANYILKQYSLLDKKSVLFMANKKENENSLEAFDVTFLIQKTISKNFSIYTGLNYGQIDSKLDFAYKESKTEEVETVTKMIVNSIKDTTSVYERAMIKSYYDVNEKIYNYRKYLRIPILLAYHGKITGISYEIRSGIDLNILTSNKGRAITPKGNTSLISATNINLEKKKTLGDFHFDLRFDIPISKNMILTYGPQYKLNLESLMQISSGFSQYNHSLGFNIGMKYKL